MIRRSTQQSRSHHARPFPTELGGGRPKEGGFRAGHRHVVPLVPDAQDPCSTEGYCVPHDVLVVVVARPYSGIPRACAPSSAVSNYHPPPVIFPVFPFHPL